MAEIEEVGKGAADKDQGNVHFKVRGRGLFPPSARVRALLACSSCLPQYAIIASILILRLSLSREFCLAGWRVPEGGRVLHQGHQG